MKFVYCLVVLFAAVIANVSAEAGQSACQDPTEVGQTYQHHIDPTKYWFCEQLGQPALEKVCPKDMAYMHYLKECIPWPNWVWKKLENPPTLA